MRGNGITIQMELMYYLCHTLSSPLTSSPFTSSLSWTCTVDYWLNDFLPLFKSADIGMNHCWKYVHHPEDTAVFVCAFWIRPRCSCGQRLGQTRGPQQVTGLKLLWLIWLWRQMFGCRPFCGCVRSLARLGSWCRARHRRFYFYFSLNG